MWTMGWLRVCGARTWVYSPVCPRPYRYVCVLACLVSNAMHTAHKIVGRILLWGIQHTGEPLNKGHFGDDINSADLFFVERLSSLGGSKYIVQIILGPQAVSFVERFIILCPYLGESTVRGSTVRGSTVRGSTVRGSTVRGSTVRGSTVF